MSRTLPRVFLYSGQGSQYPGMGRALFASEPAYRETLFRAERLLRGDGGPALIDTLCSDDEGWLRDLTVSHPAILAVEWAATHALAERGIAPDIVLGASLGEYAALAAAGSVSFEEMLRMVHSQAQLAAATLEPGGMLAVIGDFQPPLPAELAAGVTLAARNFDRHTVWSGPRDALLRCRERLERSGATCSELPVAYAFHSSAVDPLREGFLSRWRGVRLAAPTLPLVSCAAAATLERVAAEHLWNIVRAPIRFADSIRMLEASGPKHYIDAGPSGTLATFVRYVLGPAAADRITTLMSPIGSGWESLLATGSETQKRAGRA